MKQPLTISEVISNAMIVLAVIAFLMQIPIDDSTENIVTAVIILIGSMIALLYFRYSEALQTHPISSFVIFGFCATTQYGALLVQSATFNSVSKYLRQPIYTFSVLAFYLLIAIAAHMTFRLFSSPDSKPEHNLGGLRRILEKLNLYAIPPVYIVWPIGVIGLIALLSSGAVDSQRNLGNKISIGISFLAWAPFLIPIFVGQVGRQYCNTKVHYAILTGFAALFALIGIAGSARFIIVSGVTTMSLIMLLIGMRSKRAATSKQIYQAVLVLAVCAAMLVPVGQLATAMVVVRSHRYSYSASQMVSATVDVLMDPKTIDTVRSKDKLAALTKSYDEYYIESPILARFINTKFHDTALYFAGKLTERGQDELTDTTIDLAWSLLPDPVLKFFGVNVNKSQLKFTIGDYLKHQATGAPLGDYDYGSNVAHGIAIFGWFFPVIYFGLCLLSYWGLEFLTYKNKKGEIMVSMVASLLLWRLFITGITSDSILGAIAFTFREIPQSIIIFIITYQVARLIAYPFMVADRLFTVKKVRSGNIK